MDLSEVNMTANRRIFLNIVATYVSPEGVARVAKRALCGVRSLYALVIGLFCGRMALMALVRADGRLSGGGNGKICGIR